jgi:HEAT repeat protein
LATLLDEEDDNLRAAALLALGADAVPMMCEAVCRKVPDLPDDLRHQAVDLLATRAEPCALPCLLERADDPMAEIRSLVGFGLGRIRSSDGLDALFGLIGDENHMVRANAAQAMGMIGDPAARPYLEAARKDEYGVVQDAVKAALPKIR